jgi:hypothetical protein
MFYKSYKTSLLAVALIPFIFTNTLPALADTAKCPQSICISVSTDPSTGKIIISGRKQISGGVNSATITPKPIIHRVTPPTVKKKFPPQKTSPVIHSAPVRQRVQTPRKASTPHGVVKKAAPIKKRVTTPGISLSDQISQLIPGGGIYATPSALALVNTPITIWSSVPSTFSTTSLILGVPVQLILTPTYIWNFGDGSTSTTHEPGAPYPRGDITHQYSHAGNYQITLQVSWWGSWIANNITTPLLGSAITNSYTYPITVITAPSRFIS